VKSNTVSFIRSFVLAAILLSPSLVFAQYPPTTQFFQPLSQHAPPGLAAQWSAQLGKVTPGYFQPVRVLLPGEGRVTFYHGKTLQPIKLASPAQVGLHVGHVYRFRISHLVDFAGVELYPSIEMLDRLHPPSKQRHEFPIPIEFTREEIESAALGHLVTRVVYLEQPQFALPYKLQEPLRVRTLHPGKNLLAEADRLGRPMLIVRLGGRLPSHHAEDASFYGSRGPIEVPRKVKAKSKPAPKPNSNKQKQDQ
jgi:hypothetical protein